jgi:TIR domain
VGGHGRPYRLHLLPAAALLEIRLLLFKDLTTHGFDVFMDVGSINSGEFEHVIFSQIEAREHFIVLLEPGSLDRIGEEGDWMRREIAHALDHRRNVVPVFTDGFKFHRDLVLPADVARLAGFNGVSIPPEYVDKAMERLRNRFLETPPIPTVPPPPKARSIADQVQRTLTRAEDVTTVGGAGPARAPAHRALV